LSQPLSVNAAPYRSGLITSSTNQMNGLIFALRKKVKMACGETVSDSNETVTVVIITLMTRFASCMMFLRIYSFRNVFP
jgi:hypothetical protein